MSNIKSLGARGEGSGFWVEGSEFGVSSMGYMV
jgi:hypothetical protein